MLDNLPNGSGNRISYSKQEYIRYISATILLIALIVGYVFEFRWFSRYLHFKGLLLGSLLVGLMIGILLAWRSSRQLHDRVEKIQVFAFFIMMCTLFAPLLGSVTNRLLPRATQNETVEIWEVQQKMAEPFGVVKGNKDIRQLYRVFLLHDQQIISFTSENNYWKSVKKGDTTELVIKKGLWGATYVMDK